MLMRRLPFLILFLISLSVTAQQAKYIQFREEAHDFGSIRENGGPVMHEFLFTNTTNRPVTIVNVQASCGSTTPDSTKDPVAPGKARFIQARDDRQGRPGFGNRALTGRTDYGANPSLLQSRGIGSPDGVGSDSDFKV